MKSISLRPALLAAAVSLVVAGQPVMAQSTAPATSAAVSAVHSFNIPAGSLENSLSQIARQSGVTIAADSSLVRGKQAGAISGNFSAAEAASRALSGTGLTLSTTSSGALSVQPATGAVILPAVNISAATVAEATEGSGSYSVGASGGATRLALSVRETPQSVSVVTRQRLDDMGTKNINDVMSQITGVYVTENDTERTSFVSRGYAIDNYRVDGMSSSRGDGFVSMNYDMAIYDNLTVLRGASGMLSGTGDPGGAVSLKRKRPGKELAGYVSATAGRWDYGRVEVDVGSPIAFDGKLRGRTVLVRQKSESFRDYYKTDKDVVYGILEADLTDSTLFTLGYDYQKPDTSGVTWGTVLYYTADGELANLPRSTSYTTPWSRWPIQQEQWFAQLDQKLGDKWNVKLAYTDTELSGDGKVFYGGGGFLKSDGTGLSAWTMHSIVDSQTDVFEIAVDGSFELFNREHTLVFGYEQMDTNRYSPQILTEDLSAAYYTIEDWRNWTGNRDPFNSEKGDFNVSDFLQKNSGAYLTARFSVLDPLTVIVGARLTNWETRTRNYEQDTGAFRNSTGYKVEDELTPYVGVVYDINSVFSVYASYADLFQPQNRRDVNNEILDPIVGDNLEVGVKAEIFDGKLTASAAWFEGEKSNLAEIDDTLDLLAGSFDSANPPAGFTSAGRFMLPGGDTPYKSTGKGTQVSGYELDIQGQITDNWNFSAGYSNTLVENAAGVRLQTNRPRELVRLFTTYRLPENLNKITVGGGLTWQGGLFTNFNKPTGSFNANGNPVTSPTRVDQGSFALINLMARYQVTDNFSAALNINNLTDKHYYRNIGFYQGVHWGEPRNIQLTAKYSF